MSRRDAHATSFCDPGNSHPPERERRSLDRADSCSTASEDNQPHNLWMILWTTGGDCGRIRDPRNLSTDRLEPSTGSTPGYPHPAARADLRRHRLSTQLTAPITVTAFVCGLRSSLRKTGGCGDGDRSTRQADMSTCLQPGPACGRAASRSNVGIHTAARTPLATPAPGPPHLRDPWPARPACPPGAFSIFTSFQGSAVEGMSA